LGGTFGTSSADEIQFHLELLANHEDVRTRWPKLAKVMATLASELHGITEAIDNDLSWDGNIGYAHHEIKDDEQFEQESLRKLYDAVGYRQGELPL